MCTTQCWVVVHTGCPRDGRPQKGTVCVFHRFTLILKIILCWITQYFQNANNFQVPWTPIHWTDLIHHILKSYPMCGVVSQRSGYSRWLHINSFRQFHIDHVCCLSMPNALWMTWTRPCITIIIHLVSHLHIVYSTSWLWKSCCSDGQRI